MAIYLITKSAFSKEILKERQLDTVISEIVWRSDYESGQLEKMGDRIDNLSRLFSLLIETLSDRNLITDTEMMNILSGNGIDILAVSRTKD